MFNALKCQPNDPRIQPWAYIDDGEKLIEVVELSSSDVIGLDALTGVRWRIAWERIRLRWEVAKAAPSVCPDFPSALDQPPQEEATWRHQP